MRLKPRRRICRGCGIRNVSRKVYHGLCNACVVEEAKSEK